MGIDIYLNGYDAFKERTKDKRSAFHDAVKLRDRHPRGSREAEEAQRFVDVTYGALFSGDTGYVRSSYNSGGLFNVLQEIFGFDVGGWLFPGSWDSDVVINGTEFVAKVDLLERVALFAMQNNHHELPWIAEYTEISGELAPYPNEAHVQGEAFGDLVRSMLSSAMPDAELSPKSREQRVRVGEEHVWCLTTGLRELRQFGECAVREGSGAFAYISY